MKKLRIRMYNNKLRTYEDFEDFEDFKKYVKYPKEFLEDLKADGYSSDKYLKANKEIDECEDLDDLMFVNSAIQEIEDYADMWSLVWNME